MAFTSLDQQTANEMMRQFVIDANKQGISIDDRAKMIAQFVAENNYDPQILVGAMNYIAPNPNYWTLDRLIEVTSDMGLGSDWYTDTSAPPPPPPPINDLETFPIVTDDTQSSVDAAVDGILGDIPVQDVLNVVNGINGGGSNTQTSDLESGMFGILNNTALDDNQKLSSIYNLAEQLNVSSGDLSQAFNSVMGTTNDPRVTPAAIDYWVYQNKGGDFLNGNANLDYGQAEVDAYIAQAEQLGIPAEELYPFVYKQAMNYGATPQQLSIATGFDTDVINQFGFDADLGMLTGSESFTPTPSVSTQGIVDYSAYDRRPNESIYDYYTRLEQGRSGGILGTRDINTGMMNIPTPQAEQEQQQEGMFNTSTGSGTQGEGDPNQAIDFGTQGEGIPYTGQTNLIDYYEAAVNRYGYDQAAAMLGSIVGGPIAGMIAGVVAGEPAYSGADHGYLFDVDFETAIRNQNELESGVYGGNSSGGSSSTTYPSATTTGVGTAADPMTGITAGTVTSTDALGAAAGAIQDQVAAEYGSNYWP